LAPRRRSNQNAVARHLGKMPVAPALRKDLPIFGGVNSADADPRGYLIEPLQRGKRKQMAVVENEQEEVKVADFGSVAFENQSGAAAPSKPASVKRQRPPAIENREPATPARADAAPATDKAPPIPALMRGAVDPAPSRTAGMNWRTIARRLLVAGVISVILAAVIWEGIQYRSVGRFIQSTDDAYVQADAVIVAPKVAGYISALLVDDNQSVRAGQVLARIDDRDLRASLDEATANVAAAQASVGNLNAQLPVQDSLIRQADASVAAGSASLSLARRNEARRREMARVGYGTDEQADTASTDTMEKAAGLERLQAAATLARQQVDVLTTQLRLAQAQLRRAEAARRQAEINLSYATIVSPIDGVIGTRTARKEQYVQVGTQLMAVVPLQQVYVVANFKETQLTNVMPGQPARIRADAFPGHDIVGRVDSLAPASGLEFSLLPPDNATGNFTKIVQRVPVKIVFDGRDPLAGRLRPGMSVNAAINTKTDATE
jgi:membrane fusion protein (multidrug efflux system)